MLVSGGVAGADFSSSFLAWAQQGAASSGADEHLPSESGDPDLPFGLS